MSRPTQFEKIETLRFTIAELISGVGVLGFLTSLALPAIKHGEDQLGIACFIMALFCAFSDSVGSERQLMSIASHGMHVACLCTVLFIWNRIDVGISLKSYCSIATVLCAAYIATVPYQDIGAVYFGFYLWLASMLLITVAQYMPSEPESPG